MFNPLLQVLFTTPMFRSEDWQSSVVLFMQDDLNCQKHFHQTDPLHKHSALETVHKNTFKSAEINI